MRMIGGAIPYRRGPLRLPFEGGHHALLTNARSCLHAMIQLLKPDNVWLPSYVCRSVISKGFKFYPVSGDLKPSLGKVGRNDLVLAVDYFGWPHGVAADCLVVEDACQAFFSEKRSEFVLYSPPKCLGAPDGGILWAKDMPLNLELVEPPEEWIAWARKGRDRGDPEWFAATQVAKKLSPTGPYKMRHLECLSYEDEWPAKCRANYLHLYDKLSHLSLMGLPPDGVIPSGFPVVLEDRDGLREWLFRHRIYPPVHWDIEGVVPPEFTESHLLSKRIMTLPCDYRYDQADMGRTAECVLDYLGRA